MFSPGRVIILRHGAADKTKWYEEEVNFYNDYKELFGAEPGKAQGIGLLTGSDSHEIRSPADHDDFVLLS
ncbi:MAG TPA: DUF3047 domain-containing protein [Candidatus Acidoferrales bacterium]|nr:DUF3047 domain-containing protein [Candidatus Acidoferrales bacterium]